jgi:hypothetical protein
MSNAKSSHTGARAQRHKRPAPAADTQSGPPSETVNIAVGPNTTGHTDQISSVHVDEEGFAPADAATEVGQED